MMMMMMKIHNPRTLRDYSQRARVPPLLKKFFSASSYCWWDSASALSTIMEQVLGFNAFIVMLYCMEVSIGLIARFVKALVYELIGWWFESDRRRFFFIFIGDELFNL